MDQAAAKIASLFNDGKFDEIAAQYQASAPTEETCAGLYVLAAQYLSALPLSREGLEKMWQQMKQLLQQAGPQISLALASAVQDTAARCTAAFYRACNDRLKLEYALLQKDVCFEKKEYVIRRMQELLLQADVDFSAALGVLDDAAELVTRTDGLSAASEQFFLATLRMLQNAAQIAEDNGLLDCYPPHRLARLACSLPIDPRMSQALEKRKALLELTLRGDYVLEQWDFYAPYAEQAGISLEKLIKEQKKRRRAERLRFWKKKTAP